jgi:hypothetical protein
MALVEKPLTSRMLPGSPRPGAAVSEPAVAPGVRGSHVRPTDGVLIVDDAGTLT